MRSAPTSLQRDGIGHLRGVGRRSSTVPPGERVLQAHPHVEAVGDPGVDDRPVRPVVAVPEPGPPERRDTVVDRPGQRDRRAVVVLEDDLHEHAVHFPRPRRRQQGVGAIEGEDAGFDAHATLQQRGAEPGRGDPGLEERA